MAFGDILERAITLFIIVLLVIVMAPVMIMIGNATSQPWFGYLGAGILILFGIVVLFATIAKIFDW